jgi:hypothetical protein
MVAWYYNIVVLNLWIKMWRLFYLFNIKVFECKYNKFKFHAKTSFITSFEKSDSSKSNLTL